MAEVLLQAYTPLLLWTGLGLLVCRWLPTSWPRALGRSLYWVGVPLEVFSLARHTHFSTQMGLAPAGAALAVVLGAVLGFAGLSYAARGGDRALADPNGLAIAPNGVNVTEAIAPAAPWWQQPATRGSYVLSAMLGNTGFVGLAIAPLFLDPDSAGFPAFYAISQNVLGTYGLGVWVASSFSSGSGSRSVLQQVQTLCRVPSLWGFALGVASQPLALPQAIETVTHGSVGFVIPTAFVLMGIRLGQLQGWDCLRVAAMPAFLKTIAVPAVLGLGAIAVGIDPQLRLGLVLMSGMPTAFACLILAEEYDLDRAMIATSIALTTALVLVAIPIWLLLFG